MIDTFELVKIVKCDPAEGYNVIAAEATAVWFATEQEAKDVVDLIRAAVALRPGEQESLSAAVRHVQRNVDYSSFLGFDDEKLPDPFDAVVRVWPEVRYK